MTSQRVERTWIRTGGYGRFRGEWVRYGFHLFSVGQSRSYESPNLLSARQQAQVVDQRLAKELEAQRLAGPFDTPPFLFSECHPWVLFQRKPQGNCV